MTETPNFPILEAQAATPPTSEQIDSAESAGFVTPTGDDAIRNGDDAITNNAVVAYELIKAATPYKGVLPDGTDINDVRTPGVYTVASTTSARTMLNWPTLRAGTLTVNKNKGSNTTTQDVLANVSSSAPTERYTRATISLSGGWSPWASAEWVKGSADNTNLDTFRTPGSWYIAAPATVTGMPAEIAAMPALIEVVSFPTSGIALQRISARKSGTEFHMFYRMTLTVAGFTGIEWKRIAAGSSGGGVSAPADPVSDHAGRVEYARSRRGGGTGTAGRPVVMLRFDHWLANFRDNILPILREFHLPATLNVNYDNMGIPANGSGSITWDDVQAWNQYDGIEIANHGSTHKNADTREAIYHEIVEGRRNLEAAMPRVAVETWQEHGSAYLVATDDPTDIGLDLGREPRNFFESYAGKLVLAEHAVIEGKSGGFYHPITGHPQIGQSHISVDRSTAAEAKDYVRQVQSLGRAVTLYVHPGTVGTTGSDGTVYMSLDDFRELCAHIAAERDAGRLMVMTAAGGAFANRHSDHRENVLTAADFGDGWQEWWSNYNEYTITNPGPDVVLASSSSAVPLSQRVLLYSRFGWAMGAVHELVVRAKATAPGAQLTIAAEQIGNPENWQVSQTFDLDDEIRECRVNLTLPRDTNISQLTFRIGGPSLEIHGAPLLAAI